MQTEAVRKWLDGAVPAETVLVAVEEEMLGQFSNEVLRLRLRWSPDDSGAPETLIVKRRIPGREAPASEAFAQEARVLGELAATAPVLAPRVHAVSDDLLVMEELVGLSHFDFVAGASDEHVDAGLRALGRFHAHGLGIVQPSWLPSFSEAGEQLRIASAFRQVWNDHRTSIEALVPTGFAALADTWAEREIGPLAGATDPQTVLHGDAHGENLPMSAAGIAFLDWAGARHGAPAFDVAVFLGMSLPKARRRTLERSSVRAHSEAWLAAGGTPLVDPWQSYARALLLRAFHLISQVRDPALLGNPGFALVVGRCAQAALDHVVDTELG